MVLSVFNSSSMWIRVSWGFLYPRDVHLVRPVDVQVLHTVACFEPLHSEGHVVVAVEHDTQGCHKVYRYHCHCVRNERAVNERKIKIMHILI